MRYAIIRALTPELLAQALTEATDANTNTEVEFVFTPAESGLPEWLALTATWGPRVAQPAADANGEEEAFEVEE